MRVAACAMAVVLAAGGILAETAEEKDAATMRLPGPQDDSDGISLE